MSIAANILLLIKLTQLISTSNLLEMDVVNYAVYFDAGEMKMLCTCLSLAESLKQRVRA